MNNEMISTGIVIYCLRNQVQMSLRNILLVLFLLCSLLLFYELYQFIDTEFDDLVWYI